MKRIAVIAGLLLLALVQIPLDAQVKKPTLMVVPSDTWCTINGYVSDYESAGISQKVPDYRLALQSDPVL